MNAPQSTSQALKMVQLFLSEPTWSDIVDDESVKHHTTLLNNLQSLVWSLLMSHGGRAEARLWLCNSISSINSVTPCHRREIFVKILRSKPLKKALAAQILQMVFEKLSRKAGSILAERSHLLESFFKGNPRRILQWFSSFSGSGNLGHRKGAKALSQFAFVNRDICWEELEWKGKHGQSPAVVATKPHYFLDLDVQQTVENFIDNVPEFWSSNEFADSLEDVVSQGRQILRLLHEEGDEDEKLKIKDFVAQICMCSSDPGSLAPFMKECCKEKSIESVKWLGVQSWALHYRLSEVCRTPESWESVFMDNRISFRKSGNYEFLHHDGFSEDCESDLDERASVKLKRKKKEKRRKKKRKNLGDGDCYDDELLDLDMSKDRLSSRAGSWLLSTDGYSTSWSSVDLPEHLSKYCFSTWMKWVFTRWSDGT